MIDPTKPRWAQSPDDAAGAGAASGAGVVQAKAADAVASVTQPAGQAGAGASKKDGGTSAQTSELGSGAAQGDASKGGKATGEAADKDAGGATTPTPVKVQLPEKLPDGVTVDEGFVKGFEVEAAKAGLDSSKASSLVAWYLEQQSAQTTKIAQDMERWSAENRATLAKDPEYGGTKLAESRAAVQRCLSRFDPKSELKTLLTDWHLDNHPVVAKALASIGRALAGDKLSVEGEGKGVVASSEAKKMASLFPSHEKLRKEMGE
jgi:hypothetical protein